MAKEDGSWRPEAGRKKLAVAVAAGSFVLVVYLLLYPNDQ